MKRSLLIFSLIAAVPLMAGIALATQSCQKSAASNINYEPYTAIRPGAEWLDTSGRPIQAHGFSVIYDEGDKCYYWYGEDKERTLPGSNVWTWGVRCYSSRDFYNWDDRGHIIEPDTVDVMNPLHYSQILDRPHIIYCPKTNKYVCWIKNQGSTQFYTILQAEKFLGPYEIVNPAYRPNGYAGGDFDLYCDEATGCGYIWFERPHWELLTMQLNDDFTGVTDSVAHNFVGRVPPFSPEAPTHFVRNGKHYLFTSGTTGYYPNRSTVSTFDDYMGEYVELGNPHPNDSTASSYFSQITEVIKIPGKKDLYVACADRWLPGILGTDMPRQMFAWHVDHYKDHRPEDVNFDPVEFLDRSSMTRGDVDATYDARYVWLPIRFDENDMPIIEWVDEWRIEDFE